MMLLAMALTTAGAGSSSCGGALLAARCDGRGDATAALQAALVACAEQREALTLPAGRTCLSLPLSLPSNTRLELPAGTALKAAGPVGRWPNCSWTASPFDSPVNYCRPNATGGAPPLSSGSGTVWQRSEPERCLGSQRRAGRSSAQCRGRATSRSSGPAPSTAAATCGGADGANRSRRSEQPERAAAAVTAATARRAGPTCSTSRARLTSGCRGSRS